MANFVDTLKEKSILQKDTHFWNERLKATETLYQLGHLSYDDAKLYLLSGQPHQHCIVYPILHLFLLCSNILGLVGIGVMNYMGVWT